MCTNSEKQSLLRCDVLVTGSLTTTAGRVAGSGTAGLHLTTVQSRLPGQWCAIRWCGTTAAFSNSHHWSTYLDNAMQSDWTVADIRSCLFYDRQHGKHSSHGSNVSRTSISTPPTLVFCFHFLFIVKLFRPIFITNRENKIRSTLDCIIILTINRQ